MKTLATDELRSAAQYAAAHAPNEEFLIWAFGRSEAEIRQALGTLAFMKTLAAQTAPWASLHRAADAFEPKVKKVVVASFDKGRQALRMAALRQALKKGNERKVLTLVSPAIEATARALAREHGMGMSYEQLLLDTLVAGGQVASRKLKGLRAAKPKATGFTFDTSSDAAAEWARKHAADTIDGISKTTRDEIRDLIEEAFGNNDYDVGALADDIASLIGDDDGARSERIARTEVMRAVNAGQQELWAQAVEAGLLTGNEQQEWIVADDDRLCPICEPMDGVKVALDDSFDVDGEQVDQPPAHPNCRCTIALVAAR